MAYYNCLLFDVDDTLLDFGAAERAALGEMLEHFQLPADEETIQTYQTINTALWRSLEKGEIKKDKLVHKRFAQFLQAIGKEGDPAALNEYYLSRLGEKAIPCEDAREVLKDLAEVATIAVVSNGVERVQQGRLTASGLAELIDATFVSERMGVTKPNRKFFDSALHILGVNNREKVLVIGDSLRADIQGGSNAGLATCWYNPRGQENASGAKPTFEIAHLRDLLPIVMEQEELDDVGNPAKRHMV